MCENEKDTGDGDHHDTEEIPQPVLCEANLTNTWNDTTTEQLPEYTSTLSANNNIVIDVLKNTSISTLPAKSVYLTSKKRKT